MRPWLGFEPRSMDGYEICEARDITLPATIIRLVSIALKLIR